MSVLTFQQAKALFTPFYSRQKEQPLDLAQRTLDRKRSRKIAQYIIKGLMNLLGFYIILPVIVTLDIPEGECFDFQSIDFGEGFEEFENNGLLRLPAGTTFWIPDGQHRVFGAILSLLEAIGLVQEESFGVMFIPDVGGKKRKQIFLDANQHGVRVNKSLFPLLDDSDPLSAITRLMLATVPVFNGRTAFESTNVTPTSTEFFSLNALKESCKLLLTGYEGNREERAVAFWSAIAHHHPDWRRLDQADALEMKKTQLSFHALALNALAIVGRQQPDDEWIAHLDRIDWSVTNPRWNEVCYFNGRIVKNSQTIRALARYIEQTTTS